jgi:hypothetical protein
MQVYTAKWVLAKTILDDDKIIQKFCKDYDDEPELTKDPNEAWFWNNHAAAMNQLKDIRKHSPETQLYPIKVFLREVQGKKESNSNGKSRSANTKRSRRTSVDSVSK